MNKQRNSMLIFLLLFTLCMPFSAAAATEGITIYFDDTILFEDASLISSDTGSGVIYHIPIREAFEKLGYTVNWDQNNQTIRILENKRAILPDKISKTVNGITVSVEPALELLSIIEFIGEYNDYYGLMTPYNFQYKDDIATQFTAYQNHPSVLLFNEWMKQGYGFHRPVETLLLLEPDFSINMAAFENPANSAAAIEGTPDFFAALRQFYVDTDFESFYRNNVPLYHQLVDKVAADLPDENLIALLENFFGSSFEGYHIVLVPLFHHGGFGVSVTKDAGTQIFSVIGSHDTQQEIPLFGDTDSLAYLQLHELGHSFIDLDTELILPWVEQSAFLFDPIAEQMTMMGYGSWPSTLEENILRATTVKIQREDNSEVAMADLQAEYDKGYLYIFDIYQTMLSYDQTEYDNFQSFIPTILEELIDTHQS